MRYEEFRLAWDHALRESKLAMYGRSGSETLDLDSTERRYQVRVEPFGGQDCEPFYVTAALSFRWDPLHAARTRTTEDDMLITLFGRADSQDMETEKPCLRIDIELVATLPWGKALPMPSKAAWSAWLREVTKRLDDIEPLTPAERVRESEQGNLEVLAWQGAPTATFACGDSGELLLECVRYSAFQLVETPRVLDDPDLQPDPDPRQQLHDLFARVKASLSAWMQGLDHLKRR
jgi:hypothetical protein